MKVAFVGHPYHKKTKSAEFFISLLESQDLILERFYDDFFYNNKPTCLVELLDGDHDVIILWQTEYLAPKLLAARKRVVVVPMYDAARLHRPEFWNAICLSRVISFCRRMHDQFQERMLDTSYFQYFPDPSRFEVSEPDPARLQGHGFAWIRRPWEGVTWPQARNLMRAVGTETGHVHMAVDNDRDKTSNL